MSFVYSASGSDANSVCKPSPSAITSHLNPCFDCLSHPNWHCPVIRDPIDGDYTWQIDMIDEDGEAVGVYTNDEWHPSPVLAYADGYIHYLLER